MTEKETTEKVRRILRGRFEQRRTQKMANRLPVNLNFYPSLEGLRQELRSSYQQLPAEQAPRQLHSLFIQTHGRLLLLGRPGAGKTMQVIELAMHILESEPDALPVVLNLATWTDEYPNLQSWLLKTLPYELGVNEPLAERLLANNRVILLLDGFDEIQEIYRPLFFEKMAIWVAEHPQQEYLISSRVDEYLHTAAQTAPPVTHQPVEVAPLQADQLRSALQSLAAAGQVEGQRFLAAIEADSLLEKIAETPFYFNCLQSLFALKPYPDWHFQADSLDSREAEITTFFVRQELQKCKPETETYLRYLASEMQKRKMVKVELVDLQYDWVKLERASFVIMVLINIVAISLPAIFLALFIFLRQYILIQLIIIFAVFSIIILLLCFTKPKELASFPINTKDRKSWFGIKSASTILNQRVIRNLILIVYFISFVSGILTGILAGIGYILVRNIDAPATESFLTITHPYQRFIASAKNLHFSILQHWHLRYIIAKRGYLPWRLVSFLNEMTPLVKNKDGILQKREFTTDNVYLMESDGATWRFRHATIQNWFSS